MILDSLENAENYYNDNPRFRQAFEFLKRTDPDKLEGRTDIDGDHIYALVIETNGQGHEGAELEIHKRYIDIQFGVGGLNEFGWKPASACVTVTKPFDEADDYGFFGEKPDVWIPVPPGQFAVFFPEDAHTPKGGTGKLRKIIIKVAVD